MSNFYKSKIKEILVVRKCPRCDGHGQITWYDDWDDGAPAGSSWKTTVCFECRGRGEVTSKVTKKELDEIWKENK